MPRHINAERATILTRKSAAVDEAVPITLDLRPGRASSCPPETLSQWVRMVENQLQLDPTIEEADQRRSVFSVVAFFLAHESPIRHRRFTSTRAGAAQQEIPKGHLRATTYRRDAIYRRALALADVASAAIAVLVGVPILGDDALNPLALLALPLVLVVGKVAGLYDRDEHLVRRTTLDEVPTLFWAATLYAFLIWLGGNLIVVGQFGRDQAIGVWALFFLSMVSIRALARYLAGTVSGEVQCLVLGDAETASWITRRFDETSGLRARVVGRAPLAPASPMNGNSDHNGNGANGNGANGNGANGNGANGNGANGNGANGNGANLKRLLATEQIERAIMAPRGELSDDLLNTTRSLTSMGLRVSVLPRLPEVVGSSVELDEVDGVTLLGMRRFGLNRSSRAIKRCFDLVGAGLGLLLVSPFLAAIAIAIKVDSSGPVFFRQRRMGRNGVHFEMLKFRTMVDGAEAQKGALAARNEAGGGLFKIKDDPRVTRVGTRPAADLARRAAPAAQRAAR